MIPNEQPLPYTPAVNVRFPVVFDPRSNIFSDWELVKDDERICVEIEAHVYASADGPKEHPDDVSAAALLRIRNKLINKDYFLCFEADDVELLAFDNEALMAKLREFVADTDHRAFHVSIAHYIYDKPATAVDAHPVASMGYFDGIRREYLQIDLLDATTMDVIKPIYGTAVASPLANSI